MSSVFPVPRIAFATCSAFPDGSPDDQHAAALAEAGRLCRKVAILDQGALLAFGRPEDLARERWPWLTVDIELGGAAGPSVVETLRAVRGVSSVVGTGTGARVRVIERDVLPHLVAALVTRETAVYGVIPRPPTLEDVYLAVTGKPAPDGVER